MAEQPAFEPAAIFDALSRSGVRFVLIGGLAGAAQGAGWPTYDADILIDESSGNLDRLLVALTELDAV